MIYLLYTMHVLISMFLILVVLLQRGKGADLSVFGGGATQAAFGARGQASVLHKLTVVCFVLFILTTLTIGLFEAGRQPSVMGGVPGASAASVEPATTESDVDAGVTPAGVIDDGATTTEEPVVEEETPEAPPPAESGDGAGS
ncbi:MAG TPA: preprotein translocase subunit SecG [Thermoanaerobaculia bacterium]|nr:preprotein translocase subunit SecG [Thermoanaerobaculia bacterium]